MKVKIRKESGYPEALLGFALSYKDRATPDEGWITDEMLDRADRAMGANANRGGGHNKFRESMVVWLDIEAARYWWSEFDTYRVGVTKQSESSMHTLAKRDMELADLEHTDDQHIRQYQQRLVNIFNEARVKYPAKISIQSLKALVPDSYLQRRIVCTNYQTLANIINQRKNHRLPEWRELIEEIYNQVCNKRFLPEYPYADKAI
jgi:hypothetical protein